MGIIEDHQRIKQTRYEPWQIYLLITSLIVCLGLYYNIPLVTTILYRVESAGAGLEWVVILAAQGVLIGFVAEYLYEHGDRYAKSTSYSFDNKNRTYLVRIGAMTVVAAVVTLVIPEAVRSFTNYLVIQTVGVTIAAGILLVHTEITNWRAKNEWPALLAGALLALGPSVL